MNSQLIYLDNNATTRPAPKVIAAVLQSLESNWANPSSIHGLGREVAREVEAARDQVAALLGVRIEQIVFTAGATEANEAVLRFYAAQGAVLITSAAEHAAVAGVYLRHMPERVRSVKLNEDGLWCLDCLQEILSNTKGKKLVALAWANGETGVLQDLLEIATLAERHGAACLIDATQAVGRVTVKAPDTAYLTFSGHKLHGPKGIGVLVQPKAWPPVEVAVGGGQEGGWRGGTLNVPGIVGLGVACEHRYRSLPVAIARMELLRDLFEEQIAAEIPDLRINGMSVPRVPNTSNLTFPGVDGIPQPIARQLLRGLNRMMTGEMTITDDRLWVTAPSGVYMGSEIPLLVQHAGRARAGGTSTVTFRLPGNQSAGPSDNGRPPMIRVVTQAREDLAVDLALRPTLVECLLRISDGALPASFSSECQREVERFQLQVATAVRQAFNGATPMPKEVRMLDGNLQEHGIAIMAQGDTW